MSWERFSYLCRKVKSTLRAEESISEGIARVEKEPACKFYGDRPSPDSLPKRLLRDVSQIRDKQAAMAALEIYSKMDMSQQLAEPMQFKRVTTYLAYIAFIFFIVSGIYQVKVAPAFFDAFEAFELSVPSHLVLYREYWRFLSLLISVLLFSGLIIGLTLRGLFKLRLGQENYFIVRFLTIKGIRESYLNIIAVLSFPTSAVFLKQRPSETELESHLAEIANSDLCLATEMQEILKTQILMLLHRCETQMRLISISVAVIVIAAIFFFLVSAYSPLFILGETV